VKGLYPSFRGLSGGAPYAIDCIGCGIEFTPREGMDVIAAWNRRAPIGLVKLLTKLTGGRPMRRLGYAFTDKVSGESVDFYRDLLGRDWMATGAWSLFRVRRL
jgi:hypothetical protein